MAAILTPSSQLGFNRPLTRNITKCLLVHNPNDGPIAFKVKTTAPKMYVVRPNSGRVEAMETVEVAVTLQAAKEDPPLNARCKDKFLIQTTSLAEGRDLLSSADLWSPVEGEEEETVHQQKIRVNWLPEEGQAIPEDYQEHSFATEGNTSRFETVRGGSSPPPAVHDANGHAEPTPAAAAAPPAAAAAAPPATLPTSRQAPPDRVHSPGDFIVAQEETTTYTILHDTDEPPPIPARAPSPPVTDPQPEPVIIVPASSGPAHQVIPVPYNPEPAPAPVPVYVPAPAPAPVPAPPHIEERDIPSIRSSEIPAQQPSVPTAEPPTVTTTATATARTTAPPSTSEAESAAAAATAAAAAAATEQAYRAQEHLELSQRYHDALEEISRLQSELGATQQVAANAKAQVMEAQAQVSAAQQDAAAQQAAAAAANAAAQQAAQQVALHPVGVRRRTTRVVSEDGETVAETGLDDGSEDEGTAFSGITGMTSMTGVTGVNGDPLLAPPVVEGVPLQVVGIIALMVFIATYLFF